MSPIGIEPGQQEEITLWSWRPGSGRPPPLRLIGGLLLVVGSVFLLVMGNIAYEEHRLALEGKLTDGIVIKKVLNQASDNGTSNTSYAVDYTFTTAEGRKITGENTVDPDVWDQLKEGGPVQIDYAASKPELNQVGPARGNSWWEFLVLGVGVGIWLLGAIVLVKGVRARSSAQAGITSLTAPVEARAQAERSPGAPSSSFASTGMVTQRSFAKKIVIPKAAVSGILLLIGAIFLLVALFDWRHEQALRAEGRTATGIVLTKSSKVEDNYQNNTQRTHYYVGYRFTTEDGTSIRGSEEVNWPSWTSIQERDPVQIIYLPRQPSKNRLATDAPDFGLWLSAVLGGLLSVGGVILLGRGALSSRRPALHR